MQEKDIIKDLLLERAEIDRKIFRLVQKERASRKFLWGRFFLVVLASLILGCFYDVNAWLFPKTSIWSWAYWGF